MRNSLPPDWEITPGHVPYEAAVSKMEQIAEDIHRNAAREKIWLVEHPALYTAGTSANSRDLVTPDRFPVHKTGRGGQYTYHGPGQRVAYVMLDLNCRKKDVRLFVHLLEQWIINTLDQFNIRGERREKRIGVWVQRKNKPPMADGRKREDKIAALGIRIRKWVTFHGISINVDPDLEHFSGIVPCGVTGHGTTSLVDLGLPVTMDDLDIVLRQEFEKLFS